MTRGVPPHAPIILKNLSILLGKHKEGIKQVFICIWNVHFVKCNYIRLFSNFRAKQFQLQTNCIKLKFWLVKVERSETDQVEDETKQVDKSDEATSILEAEKLSALPDLALKNDEIDMLRAELEEKAKQLEVSGEESQGIKNQLNEAALNILSAQVKEKEISLKLNQLEEELEVSKGNAGQLNEKLQAMERAKEALEAEMKKMRVQTEQWRKAADVVAAVLAGGVEMNGRVIEPSTGGYIGFVGSPADDLDDGFGSGKRKGSGKKMFGDLWKKKGQR
ncbi:interactor of constitutive active ROPs 1-like [Malus sylvestris]|uniref:interactor of constitutive active ROPs 1-like n=1 Tax=Malus sylvestris TaxID=3752 RepID=UPI0021AB9C30|nr:interactor of constitutive active ROPs 1-like [Malus sylvestris]